MGGGGRPVRWLRTPVGVTVLAVLLATALRLPSWGDGAYPDEGGLMLVARHWHDGGPALYGDLFVDRPPLLLLFWRTALALGGLEAARTLAMLTTAVLVVAAAATGHLLGGLRGTAWAALPVAALAANPMLGTMEVDAELLGAPWTMLAVLASLTAVLRPAPPPRRLLLMATAGVCSSAALLVKQNLVEGAVFALVLVVATTVRGHRLRLPSGRWSHRHGWAALAALGAGFALPLAAACCWAVLQGPGLVPLWSALCGFRVDAAGVLAASSSTASDVRAVRLLQLAVLSGLAALLLAALPALTARLRGRDPVALAVLSLVAVEVVGVALGGSWWPHYLVGLLPGAALLGALVAGTMRAPAPRRAGVAVVAVAGVVAAVTAASATAGSYGPAPDPAHEDLAAWLRDARHPGDSGVVTYGHPDVLVEAGLRPGYEYLWSLPMRTLDPDLHTLLRRLGSAHPPTWVVQWDDVDAWGIDPRHRVRAELRAHYRLVGDVCGFPVYLRRGADRHLPPAPAACPTTT